MLTNKFIRLNAISVLLTSTLIGAGTPDCAGGVCFAKLDNLKPSKCFQEERLVSFEKPRYIEEKIDKSETIVLDGETITVFPKSTYMASENELVYNDVEIDEELLVIHSLEKMMEESVLEKMELPNSDFFCEKNRKPLYNLEEQTFQCV